MHGKAADFMINCPMNISEFVLSRWEEGENIANILRPNTSQVRAADKLEEAQPGRCL